MDAINQQKIDDIPVHSPHRHARHDAVTGLPGRDSLLTQLRETLRQPEAMASSHDNFALLYMNLDRFRVINENFGRKAGDQVLCEVTRRIVDILRGKALLTRLDNDVFAALIQNMPSRREVIALTRTIRNHMQTPFDVADRKLLCGISIGIVFVNADELDAESIVFNAGTAMNRAKRKTMGKIAVYTRILDGKEQLRTLLESDMQQALDDDEFAVQFQPVYACVGETALLYGFEALARWNHSLQGHISPDLFINIAERSGNIVKLGSLLAEKALKTFAQWRKNSPAAQNLKLSINASAIQVNFSNLDIWFMALLEKYDIPPSCIKLELTETALIDTHSPGMRRIKHLRAMGVELSMDDFGVGYSSLAQLGSLPVSGLKIDKQFVDNLSRNARDRSVVRTILALARDFKLSVVVEGVETEDQWRILMGMGCTLFQGYYFGKPLQAEQAWALINRQDDAATQS